MSFHEDPTIRPAYTGPSGHLVDPIYGHAVASIAMVSHRAQVHIDSLRRQRYRKPSLLMETLQAFDPQTFEHCVRVSELAFRVGDLLELDRAQLRRMERAALIHDAGKLCVPLTVLNKTDRLSDVEWAVMREHSLAGEQICLAATNDHDLAHLVRHHHERLDGGGYPDALAAEEIPLPVRVLQMADIYDALTTKRAYKPAYKSKRALEIIDDEVSSGWRDRQVADALRELINA